MSIVDFIIRIIGNGGERSPVKTTTPPLSSPGPMDIQHLPPFRETPDWRQYEFTLRPDILADLKKYSADYKLRKELTGNEEVYNYINQHKNEKQDTSGCYDISFDIQLVL